MMHIRLPALGLLALLMLGAGVTSSRADDVPPVRRAELRLRDDTLVVGTVVALKDGVYTVKTGSLGTVTVPAEQVLAIRYLDGTAPAVEPASAALPTTGPITAPQGLLIPPNGPPIKAAPPPAATTANAMPAAAATMPPQMQEMMTQIISDPATMSELDKLLNDPQVLEVLNDPETMKEVNSGSYLKLMTNPKFIKLMTNPALQKIAGGVVSPSSAKPISTPAAKPAPPATTSKPAAKPARANPQPAAAPGDGND